MKNRIIWPAGRVSWPTSCWWKGVASPAGRTNSSMILSSIFFIIHQKKRKIPSAPSFPSALISKAAVRHKRAQVFWLMKNSAAIYCQNQRAKNVDKPTSSKRTTSKRLFRWLRKRGVPKYFRRRPVSLVCWPIPAVYTWFDFLKYFSVKASEREQDWKSN